MIESVRGTILEQIRIALVGQTRLGEGCVMRPVGAWPSLSFVCSVWALCLGSCICTGPCSGHHSSEGQSQKSQSYIQGSCGWG